MPGETSQSDVWEKRSLIKCLIAQIGHRDIGMSGKNQGIITFNWQSISPIIGFLPTHPRGGSNPSGVLAGAMAATNTIYSQIVDVGTMDNIALEVAWTGTPVGTFTVNGSDSGIIFPSLTFSPTLTQPAGAAGNYLIGLNQYPFRYILLQYVNTSGSGSLTVYGQQKDLN